MTAFETATCRRCGATLVAGQEYCLECGLRHPGRERLGSQPSPGRSLRLRVAALAAVAFAGGVVAIAVAATDTTDEQVLTATGGSVAVQSAPASTGQGLTQWTRNQSGWTIVLVSVPKTSGRGKAVAVARQARSRGLRVVGVVDSSLYGSLRPGYWMAFAGRYDSQAEATSSLRHARAVIKGARVAQIQP